MTTVLLADDDEQINEVVADYLTLLGCDVTRTFDAQQAIEALRRQEYDFAMLDVMMPEGGGDAVLAFIDQHCPVLLSSTIVLSAYPSAASPVYSHRVAAVLQKPFEIHLLGDLIGCGRLKRGR